ncbi:5-formyltetrahydrofolate cyclo-ligase [Pelistega sp. NLN82]|uniref:5-formyltetrahydrofolate cyclo-ligase n=1 Tax=Pelistega ratti TaxID=2652177 RepID=A0A6L9Y382_9BURK|nr:5-formyltetrahydrofolate cyclo-ligase [Pelistega ratti]NEN74822.1 5-formyltetrahydrofolate cyclo-ligase [Pelistega ratti]
MICSTDYTVLRQQLLAKRKNLSVSQRIQCSQILNNTLLPFIEQHFPKGSLITAFWPFGDEIDIKETLYHLDKKGYILALPRVVERDAPLRFYYWTNQTPMKIGHFNIPEPQMTEEIQRIPDLVLTPLLGFTHHKDRLGYGKGYYDRTLSKWLQQKENLATIGISWDEGLIDDPSYQPAPHDVPLQRILTPSGWVA